MAKSKRDQLIDDITVIVMLILSPPVFGYVAVVMAVALWPTLRLIWTLIACLGVMIGTLFGLLMEMAPVLFIFAIPLGLMLIQEFSGNDRNRRR